MMAAASLLSPIASLHIRLLAAIDDMGDVACALCGSDHNLTIDSKVMSFKNHMLFAPVMEQCYPKNGLYSI